MAVPADCARHVIDVGFVGTRTVYATKEDGIPDYSRPDPTPLCEFRDLPPAGLTFSRTTEAEVDQDEVKVTIGGGPLLADFMGDFILSIEVPDELVKPWQVTEKSLGETEPASWPFVEYWIPDTVANQHLSTLRVFVPESEEEVDPALLHSEHAVVITERFATFLTEAGEAAPVGALCLCGERWRWGGSMTGEDPRAMFPVWAAQHGG